MILLRPWSINALTTSVNLQCILGGVLNPASPEIKLHILLTVLHTFLRKLVRRICQDILSLVIIPFILLT